MGLSLDQWDAEIGYRLKHIEHHASLCVQHVAALGGRPPFQTKSEDLLARLEATLERALAGVRRARSEYGSKSIVD